MSLMNNRTRRFALRAGITAILASGIVACQGAYDYAGGRFTGAPDQLYTEIGRDAQHLIAEARKGFSGNGPVDHHVHVAGLGKSVSSICPNIKKSGVWINPDYRSRLHPIYYLNTPLFLSASGVQERSDADAQYLKRLVELVRESKMGGSYFLYALDWRYNAPPQNNEPDRNGTDLYVSNDHVVALVRCLNSKNLNGARFVAVGSVHPYRHDAVEALQRLAKQRVRFIKWLPPAQNIDPARRGLGPFYRAMKQNRISLLAHTGNEHTLRVRHQDQEFANPQRLSPALDAGVRVVMLHSGRAGRERKNGSGGERKEYFDRFLEMMKRYPNTLFGEISAVPYLGTHGRLERLMEDPRILCRLVNGSDYPLPGIAIVRPTERLLRAGYLSWPGDRAPGEAERRKAALEEIYGYNPLLFDFVMKRTIRVNGKKLPKSVFGSLPEWGEDPCPKAG